MGTNFYKLNKSLGKFRALKTDKLVKEGFCAEFSNRGMDQYNNGKFEANLYSNGELIDIEINGWTFSFHIDGRYHMPGTYESLSFNMLAVDPDGTEVNFKCIPNNTYFSEMNVLCWFLDMIHTYSNFKDAETANKFCELLRAIKKDVGEELGLEHALFFKEFYINNNNACPDRFFMKQIKETVNKAIDLFQNGIESYKIL